MYIRFRQLAWTLAVAAVTAAPLAQALPLHTCGRWLVDDQGQRVKLGSVNWYGANDQQLVAGGLDKQPLAKIAAQIRQMGFNSVRLPFANQLIHQRQTAAAAVAANPELSGLSPLEVFDRTVAALTAAGLMVILDNHQTKGGWCCEAFESDALWFNDQMSKEAWLADWEFMARRYAADPLVVGAELRNEIRAGILSEQLPLPLLPVWGEGGDLDWQAVATEAGNRLQQINPAWLIVVEGVNFSSDLSGVREHPVVLNKPHQVIYAAHSYPFFRPELIQAYSEMNETEMRSALDGQFGFIRGLPEAAAAPVWVNEFGVEGSGGDRIWWQRFLSYLHDHDLDFAYWPLNGGLTQQNSLEIYGLLQEDWLTPVTDERLQQLQSLTKATTGPQLGAILPGCSSAAQAGLTAL